MKKYILFLFVMLATSHVTLSKAKVDKDAKIDSLTKANAALSSRLDSLSKVIVIYNDFYNVIKERVIKQDFDPTRVSLVIDSVYALEKAIGLSNSILKDSLAYYKNENMQLKMSVNGITQPESVNARLVFELKLLKDLLDSKIITPAEFDIKKEPILRRWQ